MFSISGICLKIIRQTRCSHLFFNIDCLKKSIMIRQPKQRTCSSHERPSINDQMNIFFNIIHSTDTEQSNVQ